MQFHHHGYVSTDPLIKPAAGVGIDRSPELPDTMDVLIVGGGPAGMMMLAQLGQFPTIETRMIERRPHRLILGQADGIQARSVETFQAFGFAERIIAEAYKITEMAFWKPDAENPDNIVRTARTPDDDRGISEFPHLIVNQARVLDYYCEAANRGPAKLEPNYGWEFKGLTVEQGEEYPVRVELVGCAGEQDGVERVVRAKYVLGADGARSKVRDDIGAVHVGSVSYHAWGVMDVLANSDFPDIRLKCAIQSKAGSILHIPREGGYLCRMYIDLGEVPEDDARAVRKTPLEAIIKKANEILHPYTLDVKDVPWWSVYEVGHRVTDRFDDVPVEEAGTRTPRVFIAGDACHTHSAKAGQGMNVSMQDSFNLGWKLGHVLTGLAPESLLQTYTAERQEIAQNLIDFDRQWSSIMAAKPGELEIPAEEFYVNTFEFPAGFMTQYKPSVIIGGDEHQELAAGFPIGKRFKSRPVMRVSDANPLQLGHLHRADGRWRVYVFADGAAGNTPELEKWSDWWVGSEDSPANAHTPAGEDKNALFDVRVIYQAPYTEVNLNDVPAAFKPIVGPFELVNLNEVFAAKEDDDIFDVRELSRDGVVVIVRPDQYVAHVLPLDATQELADFFRPIFTV